MQHIELRPDTTLDYDDLAAKLTERTRVVAFAWASNAIGTIVDAARVCELAHSVGALAWIDAVHYAAHEPIDVAAIGADVLLCSPYKFCGPHLGIAYGRTALLESWRPYKARPAPTSPLGRRFETGTLPYELLAGFNATIDYLGEIGGMEAIVPYERALGERFLDTLPDSVTRLRPADARGPRADLPGQRRGRPGGRGRDATRRARDRRLGSQHLVFAEPLPAPRLRRRRDPGRLHPLQHGRRGRPAGQRTGRVGAALVRSVNATGGQRGN